MLKKVSCQLGPEWRERIRPLAEKLRKEGVAVRVGEEAESEAAALRETLREGAAGLRGMLWITDDRGLAAWLTGQGLACIGVSGPGEGFFRGAELVLESFEGVDRRMLEEYLLRFHGLPVIIARTGRLLLREMISRDFETLYRISRQPGMERARGDREGENSFRPDRLAAYVRQAYRLYGYGLWSAVLTDRKWGRPGQVVGCCGFVPAAEEASGEAILLTRDMGEASAPEMEAAGTGEMAYMLDGAFRRRGLGTEMCRAALEYAGERLEIRRVQVRVRPENLPALRFARSLGFR